MSMNFPPPGPPPSGQPPGGPPSDTPPRPRTNKRKIRATIYRAATDMKRATLGKDRAVKTEEIKKKKKKEEAKRPAIAPFPAPAPTPIFAPVQQGGLPAPM